MTAMARVWEAQTPVFTDVLSSYRPSMQDYESQTKEVCYILTLAARQICDMEYPFDQEQRRSLQQLLAMIKAAKEVAKLRIKQNNLECDKKALYTILAVEHIIEAVLDDEFMRITGGYKEPSDIVEFGRGLLELS